MGVMAIAEAWPTTSRAFTVEDLDQTPDDGFRYELIDGSLTRLITDTGALYHGHVRGVVLEMGYRPAAVDAVAG
jgi:hypothetical protein